MKTNILKLAAVLLFSLLMASCFSYTMTVGTGSQTGMEVKEMNHYLIGGLAPVKVSDAKVMAGDAINYDVLITHTFVDGLISVVTAGIYTPTTTIVKK
jgi:hypothetical protein